MPGSEMMLRLPNVMGFYWRLGEASSRWSPDVGASPSTLRTNSPWLLSTVLVTLSAIPMGNEAQHEARCPD